MSAYDNVKIWTVDPDPRPASRSSQRRRTPESRKRARSLEEARERTERNARLGVWARLAVVALLGGTILWWPYGRDCGIALASYLAATSMIVVGGLWVTACTWTQRMGRTHVLAMLLSLWGIGLVASEVLPHMGYDKVAPAHAASWSCTAV